MPPRRGPSFTGNTLSPQDGQPYPASMPSSPAYQQFPREARSNSPSSGFTQFLSKPSKWFVRKPSDPRSTISNNEPRASTSSVRKPKISRPTDPRPIMASFQSESRLSNASKSVLDLSTQPQRSLESSQPFPTSQPSSPDTGRGLGDLRTISRKGWSRSADDLGSYASPPYSPVDISFQNRVQDYRNRSNSSATLHAMPLTNNTQPSRHPFPTIVTSAPLSSSPPDITPESAIAISVSSPTSESFPSPSASVPIPAPAQTHTRTHSFTPRLPSKLSAQKLGFAPSSPKRKGSGSERDTEDSEKNGTGNSPSGRGVFPFSLGPSSSKHANSGPVSTHPGQPNTTENSPSLLAPPIIEPGDGQEGLRDSRRTSQIVYSSGFLNRLADAPPSLYAQYRPYSTAANLTLSKGWKSSKAELKGSKLYFYKPPSDRNAAIKELFPRDIIPVADDDEAEAELDTPEEAGRNARARDDGTIGRKKRAYWGRGTHPQLIYDEMGIEKGTFEALVHETVFSTTFTLPPPVGSGQTDEEVSYPAPWKDFSSAILLCLPLLLDRAKFEAEFTRCCANLVSGAEHGDRDRERSRVTWMAGEYLRYHGAPVEIAGWEAWRQETIPAFSWNSPSSNIISGVPKSVSTQALYAPSPNTSMASPSMEKGIFSPNLATFSPRPDDDAKMASLMEALGTHGGIPTSPSGKMSNVRQQRPQLSFADNTKHRIWSLLAQDGFSREVLSLLDPQIIALSLRLFHRRALQKLPENLTAEHLIEVDRSDDNDAVNNSHCNSSPSTALFGTESEPHWLTRLLLMQILGADSSSGLSSADNPAGMTLEERNAQTSRTHSRSEVISTWIRVGELCRSAGDECSWMAIMAALCSRPVARLSKAWKRVDRQGLNAVESWIYPEGDGDVVHAKEPIITAWGGDVRERLKQMLERAREDGSDMSWTTDPLMKTRDMFEGLRTKLSLCPRTALEESLPQEVARLVSFWQEFCDGKANQNTLALKFQRIEQFMSLSFAAEPRRKGLFEPYFWTYGLTTPHIHCHPLVPLLFVEPLPAVTLIDRGQVWRGRLESGPTRINIDELQVLQGLETSLKPITRSLKQGSAATKSREKLFSVGDVDLRGTAIPVYDGELLLVARSDLQSNSASRPASCAPSRPPSSIIEGASVDKIMSRSPSIRVKPGSSQGLERKSSLARRNSLPHISPRPNATVTEASSEKPIRVLVQAGTLDRLVNVLIHGLQGVSVAVADDNGETSLRDGKTRDLVIDQSEFARIWWHIFRSFVTPIVFFELMRKRFVNSRPSSDPAFSSPANVIRFRIEIMETIKEWIISGGGAQDCLDDVQLFEALQTFINGSLDQGLPGVSSSNDLDVQQTWNSLEQTTKILITAFQSHTMRPPTKTVTNVRSISSTSRTRTYGNTPPDIDHVGAEELVDNLNAMGAAAFNNVTEEDLFITSDLLEVQSADRTGWFPSYEVPSTEDIEIQTMYTHILEIEPSPMISELSQDAIYRLLPPSIRSCIRAYLILRKWLISKLVTPKLGLRSRQARMDLLLRAIEISRLRSLENGQVNQGCADVPCVRSFVEAVITSAVISLESRMHHRPWQNVANIRGVQCDSLATMLSKPFVPKKSYGEALIIDISWLLERILEIISIPNIVTISAENNQSVINLDKRRHLCDLVLTVSSSKSRYRDDVDRKDFERLNNIEKEVNSLEFDHRGIREEAQREALQASTSGTSSARKVSRPFQRLVAIQQEKNKRDRYLHDRLIKDKKQEQQRTEKRDDYLNKAMRPRKPMTPAQKQHRNKKSYSSAFFQLMRPISSAFTDSAHPAGIKRSPAELDFTPSGKPSLVLSIVDARVAQFINNERSFTFQLDTEDGGHYLLQAISKREMIGWIEQINRVAKLAAKRRLTYLGNSPKPQLSDHIHNHPVAPTASRHPIAVFGVDLQFLLQREAGGQDVEAGTVPFVIHNCLSEVETRGLSEVGIYRIAGATSETNALRDAFNRGESPITAQSDIHAVCDLIKSWFRLLPEPVFPSSSYYGVIEAMKLEDLNSRLNTIRSVVRGLPQANFDLLKRVTEHLDKVTDYEEHNQMTAEALAIVFSPNLLRAPQNDFSLILANMGHTHKLVKALITHFHIIFDDDLEAENDGEEDEMEEILEEDEEDEEITPSAERDD
ncbi:hypothetical protein BJ138DRAFT_1147682 [Hygrophoropsis aurantiaca]|uniref:Uncharacterized protein n=1 Tax=Hygrophoropsis aurantiaca TaxID=72124 RepID=A0ACB8AIA4_9AGAM|nr:hypothetical protein BJ138DRAFT_1147682 [Hygrophoropsis aurantiaca]